MNLYRAGTTRRWQMTISIVAALSLFVALIAGSSLRPKFAAAALPEPAAWTHGVQAHASQVQIHPVAQPNSHLEHGALPTGTPPNKKPFHSMWMTRDVPTSWTHLSPHWLALPASFAVSEFQPGGAHRAASASARAPVDRDTLLQLCVVRC